MRICSTFENKQSEKRITITPDIAKKYINLGLEVSLIENYGLHLGYDDNQYKESGVKIIKDEKELINNADIIVQLGLLADDKISLVNENQTLIGVLNPYNNNNKELKKYGILTKTTIGNLTTASRNIKWIPSQQVKQNSPIKPTASLECLLAETWISLTMPTQLLGGASWMERNHLHQ